MTARSRRPLALAALAAAAALAGPAGGLGLAPIPSAFAGEAEDAAAGLKEMAAGKDGNRAIQRIGELEANPAQVVTDAFADIARSATIKNDRVKKAAMLAAAKRKHPDLLKWLKSKLDDKKMIEDRPDFYLGVLDSVAFYGEAAKICLKDLEDVVAKYIGTNAEIAKRGVIAFGSVPSRPVIETLIKWLGQTEATKGGGQGGGGGGGKAASEETKKVYAEVSTVVARMLQKLTGEEMPDAAAWDKWWKENEKTWQPPDPNANVEPDWATIQEYTDRAFHYVLKKPAAGKYWMFEKYDGAGGRVKLHYRDDKGFLWAQVRVASRKADNSTGSTLESFAKWYEGFFREQEFEPEFAKGGEPATAAMKIGGRDFVKLSARGKGKGSWKLWESCERRIYVTQTSPGMFLYFEAAILNGTEDDIKAAYWAAIEGVTFTKK